MAASTQTYVNLLHRPRQICLDIGDYDDRDQLNLALSRIRNCSRDPPSASYEFHVISDSPGWVGFCDEGSLRTILTAFVEANVPRTQVYWHIADRPSLGNGHVIHNWRQIESMKRAFHDRTDQLWSEIRRDYVSTAIVAFGNELEDEDFDSDGSGFRLNVTFVNN